MGFDNDEPHAVIMQLPDGYRVDKNDEWSTTLARREDTVLLTLTLT